VREICVWPCQSVTSATDEPMRRDTAMARRQHDFRSRIPLRRAGRPRDQAMAVLFLASDDAAFVTGQSLIVDGGELGGGDWYDPRDAPPVPHGSSLVNR
jgi:NAD(P)-dependent dehydrogenase (short-subunit alcohol dehydrogenase family)